jgi:hypothetical protein
MLNWERKISYLGRVTVMHVFQRKDSSGGSEENGFGGFLLVGSALIQSFGTAL